jgi:glycosyltransferase involved in cell wall biosynthesis
MRVCAVVKYPPIEGGVSALSYRVVMALAAAGHQVSVVTNADEVEDDYRIWMRPQDRRRLEAQFPNGGSVCLVPTSGLGRKFADHIPSSKPFVTKLASIATEEIRRTDADVVFSYYLEPYGLAAHLAAQWTGVPHIVQHAGSDRTRLLAHPELSLAYREVLRRADVVVTRPGTIEGFGVDPARVVDLAPRGLAVFPEPDTPALDVDATIAELAAAGHPWITNTRPMPTDRATVGIYGKIGQYKGSYDLVDALARTAAAGHAFNFLVMAGGKWRAHFLDVVRDAGLADRTWTLPFLPHWRVPEFLRSLTAACFLERQFPIAIHTPGIPAEVLTVGACLVVSREIVEKQRVRDRLVHGQNAYVVEDPTDVDELAGVLGRIAEDPAAAQRVGRSGRLLVDDVGTDAELAVSYEKLFARAARLRSEPRRPVDTTSTTDDRWRLLRRFMPATVALLGDSLENVVAMAGEGNHPTVAQLTYAAGQAAVEWIGQQNGTLPAAASAAAAFELDLLWTRLDLESLDGGTLFPRRGAGAMVLSEPVDVGSRMPVTASGVRIRRHRDDIEAVLAGLRSGSGYPAVGSKETLFLFLKRGDLDGAVRRINPATQLLLRLCDGRTPVAAIAQRLEREYGVAADRVKSLLLSLAHDRVVLM